MFEVGVVTQFEAAHSLRGDFGPATRRHGHTYRLEIAVRGPALRADGTLCDIGMLQSVVEDAVAPLHYQDLDELEVFAGRNTTAEAVALALCEIVASRLNSAGLSSLSVRVWESPQAYASYYTDLQTPPGRGGEGVGE